MVKYFTKNKVRIICNVIIFVCQFMIICNVGMHGIDDYVACTYYNEPYITFSEKVQQITDRMINWNCRIGEILYYSLGEFPNFIFWIIDSFFMVILSNLITFYALGREKYKNSNKVGLLNIIVYVMMISVFPEVSKTFFWMGSAYNHVFSLIILLLVSIPFRNQIDGEDVNFKSNIKFVMYIIACFLSSFGSEAMVVTFIAGMIISNIVYIIKNKNINIQQLTATLASILGFIVLFSLSDIRVNASVEEDWAKATKESMFHVLLENRLVFFILFLIITIIYLIVTKMTKVKELLKYINMFLISSVSIFSLLFVAYYVDRAILVFDAMFASLIIYEIYEILTVIKSKFFIIGLSSIVAIICIYLTCSYAILYKDYNEFNKLREDYILNHIYDEKLVVPTYDFRIQVKGIYKFKHYLINLLESEDISKGSIEWRYGVKIAEYDIDYVNIKIR